MPGSFALTDYGQTAVDLTSVNRGDVVFYRATFTNETDMTFQAGFDMEIDGIRIEYVGGDASTFVTILWLLTSDTNDQAGDPGDTCMSIRLNDEITASGSQAFELSPYVTTTAGSTGGLNTPFYERIPFMRLKRGHGLNFTHTGAATDDLVIHIRGVAT